jgi:hypothetical protein
MTPGLMKVHAAAGSRDQVRCELLERRLRERDAEVPRNEFFEPCRAERVVRTTAQAPLQVVRDRRQQRDVPDFASPPSCAS